jgi:hypothetical protein
MCPPALHATRAPRLAVGRGAREARVFFLLTSFFRPLFLKYAGLVAPVGAEMSISVRHQIIIVGSETSAASFGVSSHTSRAEE